jgi:hypothetical protein
MNLSEFNESEEPENLVFGFILSNIFITPTRSRTFVAFPGSDVE